MNKTACVILNYNDYSRVICLARQISTYEALDAVIIVDNCSTDNSWENLREIADNKRIFVCQTDKNGGYGSGNNFGINYAVTYLNCDAVLIANPDTMFDNAMVERLKCVLSEDESCGIVSAIQMDINGNEVGMSAWKIPSVWRCILSTGTISKFFFADFYVPLEQLHSADCVKIDCVAGALLMIRSKAFAECGGYDEEMFLYYEETALACKMKENGYITKCCSDVCYHHLHGASIGKSIRSRVAQRKILYHSQKILLNKYLAATNMQMFVNEVLCKIFLAEEYLKSYLRR